MQTVGSAPGHGLLIDGECGRAYTALRHGQHPAAPTAGAARTDRVTESGRGPDTGQAGLQAAWPGPARRVAYVVMLNGPGTGRAV